MGYKIREIAEIFTWLFIFGAMRLCGIEEWKGHESKGKVKP
jgi:hypothetical protein